jgi:hypothetical protein
MKIILPIIVLLTIIILCIIIFNNNIYFSENFVGSYNQNTIEDLIPTSYIPHNPYLYKKSTEYEVIDVYKKILNRSPTSVEIELKVFLSKDELTEELYNSYEYDRLIKIQDNLAINDIEQTIAQRNLNTKITYLYKELYNKTPDERLLMTLKDCFIHLRNDPYLFLVFMQSKNYIKFENEILTTKNLTKAAILEIFDKYFNLLELKILAEDKIRSTGGDIGLSVQTTYTNFDNIHTELTNILNEQENTSNIEYIPPTTTMPITEVPFVPRSEITNTEPIPTAPTITSAEMSSNMANILKYLNSSSNANIEPFTNFKQSYGGIKNVYDITKVGNIYYNL